jgi:UTP--glucose-1-phosphate uridylyltransferase
VAVLNGGMATRFGGVVKGVVDVLPGRSFLQLAAQGVRTAGERAGRALQLVLMDSFATAAATSEHLRQTGDLGLDPGQLRRFTQTAFPRLTDQGQLFRGREGRASLYGPGHGDFPGALRDSGELAWLAGHGVRYLALCNVDNLGATADPLVLGHHIDGGRPATVELAPKWPGDKGGAPARLDGRLEIVEQYRFPAEFDQDRIPVFNTNTFVFDLAALDQDFALDWFLVRKDVDGTTAIQFERLVGQVTATLEATWLVVPRHDVESRFMPVKTPADLERLAPVIRQKFGAPHPGD